MTHTTTIRMSASEWTATIVPSSGEAMGFDLRAMNKDQRRQFHGAFMDAFRKANGIPPEKRRRRKRRTTR